MVRSSLLVPMTFWSLSIPGHSHNRQRPLRCGEGKFTCTQARRQNYQRSYNEPRDRQHAPDNVRHTDVECWQCPAVDRLDRQIPRQFCVILSFSGKCQKKGACQLGVLATSLQILSRLTITEGPRILVHALNIGANLSNSPGNSKNHLVRRCQSRIPYDIGCVEVPAPPYFNGQ